jgi:predicted ATPase
MNRPDDVHVDRLHILTGAPGTGKTAVLAGLGPAFHVVPEPARVVLAELRASGDTRTHDRDWAAFVALLLERSIEQHEAAQATDGVVVFDRGVPDNVAYAMVLGVDPAPAREAATRYRYHREVLILPPWEDIYTTDDERTMSFADTIPFHEALVDAYSEAGYALLEIPHESAVNRAALVREIVTRS